MTGFDWVLLGFTGLHLVLLGFTGFYWVLLGFTGSGLGHGVISMECSAAGCCRGRVAAVCSGAPPGVDSQARRGRREGAPPTEDQKK